MNQVRKQSVNVNKDKWWSKIHLLFSLLIISQFFLLDHQIKHVDESVDKACVVCIASVDYIDTVSNDCIINDILPVAIYKQNIDFSITTTAPNYYHTRAPPSFI